MKHFAVEVKRTSYVTIHVEANTKEQAEELAWAEIESGESYGISDDANWEVEDIYEQFATDESRAHGTHGETA
jgi:hypothetical protein